MADLKPKKATRRRVMKDGGSPVPTGPMGGDDPTCGHGGCGSACSVRYVGPTTHVRDHHILHTARGVSHIWTAAVVTGFAVVLTGAVAYTSAQGISERRATLSQATVKQDLNVQIGRMNVQINEMQETIAMLSDACIVKAAEE